MLYHFRGMTRVLAVHISTHRNEGSNDQGHNRGQLDQDVHRGTRGVLKGITHGVTGNGCFVGLAAFLEGLAVDGHAFFERLFRVVPSATGVVLEHAHQYTAHGDTREQTTQGFRTHGEAHQYGRQQGQCTRGNHLLDGCSGRDLHTLLVFGLAGTVHDAGNLAELTTHFHHHFHGRFTHSRDGQGAKEEGNHSAHEEHSQNVRLVDVNAGDARQTYVGSKEGQGRQGRRGNGKALTGSRRGVAHRVQVVRALAHLARKTAHFSNTTCVVGDRTKSVDGQLHRRSGHHTGSGNGYTVKTSQQERTVDTARQNQDGENGRFHTYSQTANDVGAVARSRLLNDAIHGAAAHRGVVFGDNAHQGTYHEAQDDGVEDVDALDRQDRTHAVEGERFGQHGFNHKVRSDSRQDHGTPVAEVQGVHHGAVFAFDAHEERTDDGEYDA